MLTYSPRKRWIALAFAAAVIADKPVAKAVDPPATVKGAAPAAKTDAKKAPADLYGDQGGEKVGPANARVPNTVMRARLEDTFLKLSNPRVDQTSGPGPKRPALLVDYEVTSRGKFDGGFLVLHTDDGGRAEIELNSVKGRDHGTVELVGVRQFGNIKVPRNVTFPENVEFYVVRGDDRYTPPARYMVSNAVVMGKMRTSTKPRDWTPEEIDRYTKPPPAYKNPNAYPDVGEDVPPLDAGGAHSRYVDPDGRLIGLDYMVGDWEKRKTLWRLVPVFSADQPPSHTARVVAKKGYAVSGAEVNFDKYVCGIRLQYQRVKPDGTLDPKDAYASEWIGAAPTGEAQKLANDGRRVIGIHTQHGAIIDRFSLVVDGPVKKE